MALTVLNAGQNYFVRGGSDRYMLNLERMLQQHGHRVIPFAGRHPRNEPTEWSSYFPVAADVERPRARDVGRYVYSLRARKSLRRLLSHVRPDIAHLHIYYGRLTAAILGPLRDMGIPIVQTCHEYKLICPVYTLVSNGALCEACEGTHYWRALPRRCNHESAFRTAASVLEAYVSRAFGSWGIDHFIPSSRFMRDKMVQYGIPSERISVLHSFVDTDGIPSPDEPGDYVLYFGRLETLKGVLTLLDAARELPHMRFVLVGDGEARLAMERRIAADALSNVTLMGFRQGGELVDLIRGSLCTVLPSEWYDNCPNSILESFVHGRAVVATRMGGIPELIDDGVDGWLVPMGDARSLADRLRWMFSHRGEAAEMGRRARQKAEADFSVENHYRQIIDIYSHVLGRS